VRPTVGEIVHFVIREGQCRPALVVRDLGDESPNLQVFLDGTNDTVGGSTRLWCTSVSHDEEGHATGTWHWPERAE
jgi:hypothetical protein